MPSIDLTFSWYVGLKTVHILSGLTWVFLLFFSMDVLQRFSDISYAKKLIKLSALAFLLSLFSGSVLLLNFLSFSQGWLHAKILCVCVLIILHIVFFTKLRVIESRNLSDVFFHPVLKFFPFVLCVAIVGLVVIQPF